jgi:hypothetical protein
MNEPNKRQVAAEMFSDWYNYCLENGVEPEEVVEEFGEMLLITDSETIEKIRSL